VVYHLAPPLLARLDPLTGEPRKMRFGAWMGGVFAVLQKLKFLRGTALDPFGYTAERKTERALIREYEDMVARLLVDLSPQNLATAVQLASLPEEIRGFGHIKLKSIAAARQKRDALLAGFNQQKAQKAAA
jgi:indolepyruvate ferredoxin oxidoreductase